jgi:hypothetical protein
MSERVVHVWSNRRLLETEQECGDYAKPHRYMEHRIEYLVAPSDGAEPYWVEATRELEVTGLMAEVAALAARVRELESGEAYKLAGAVTAQTLQENKQLEAERDRLSDALEELKMATTDYVANNPPRTEDHYTLRDCVYLAQKRGTEALRGGGE